MKPDSEVIQYVLNKDNEATGNFIKKFYGPNLKYPYTIYSHLLFRYAFKDGIKYVETADTDLIHIGDPATWYNFKNKNRVVTIHDLIVFKKIADYPKIFKLNVKSSVKKYIKSANILTDSNYVKNDIINIFDVEDVTVIPPMVSENFTKLNETKEELRKELNLPLDKKLILSVSSTERRKNLIMVENVIKNIGDDFRLVRVGAPVYNSINFSKIDNITLNKIYNACDVLYFPTLEEGFGYPVVETFKTGLPIVSSNIDVIKEVAGNSTVLVDPNSLDENIEGIHKAIENSSYYTSKGFERSKLYSKEITKEKLIKYYNSII